MIEMNDSKQKTFRHHRFLIVVILIWLLIPAVDSVGKLTLEVDDFAFRAWELFTRQADSIGPLKSSTVFEKTIWGDLANMMKVRQYRQYKHQRFTTDSYGFRNEDRRLDYYPVVVVGDSNMAGSALSDEHTFSAQLEAMLNVPVYNYAPGMPLDILGDKRFVDNPPKLVIWEGIERGIKGSQPKYSSPFNESSIKPAKAREAEELQAPRLSTHYAQHLFYEFRWHVLGLLPSQVSYVDEDSGMLFFTSGTSTLNLSNEERQIDTVVKRVKELSELFEKRGITLIYMPLPDKENIYGHMLPDSMPKRERDDVFLLDLHEKLVESGIKSIDLYRPYIASLNSNAYMFFPDDTHWNPEGVKVAAEIVSAYIATNGILTE